MKTRILFTATLLTTIITALLTPSSSRASAGRIVTGNSASNAAPHVKVFNGRTQAEVTSFFAYTSSFRGGVRVALGDVDGDGMADVIAGSGPGAAQVKVFSGKDLSELHSLLPYGRTFAGGVFVAAGDINGDGLAEIVTGADAGGGPHVKVFDGKSGAELSVFPAFPTSFNGGVRVAVGDIDGDEVADIITSAGPGGGPVVKVFSGRDGAEIRSFPAFDPQFTGGVFVGSGDLNGDGVADIVSGADAGSGPHVKVFDGKSGAELSSLFAFSTNFRGGVRVAAGDLNGDRVLDIITGAGPGGGPVVKVFSGRSGAEIHSFPAFDPQFTGGVFVGGGDLNGDGVADIIVGAGPGGGPHVKVFDGGTGAELLSFSPFPPGFAGGVRVAVGDLDGDGAPEIITGAGPGGGPVKVFSGQSGQEMRSFSAFDPQFSGGVFVGSGDVNDDGFDDIVTGAGAGGGPHVRVFDGQSGADLFGFSPFPATFNGGVRVAVGDVNGDGTADIIAGTGPGGGTVTVFSGKTREALRSFAAFETQYSGGVFVAAGDVNGDGAADIITGSDAGSGPRVKVFSGRGGEELHSFSPFPANFNGGVRVAAADLDGDGRDEILLAPGSGAAARVIVLDGLTLKETASFLAYPEFSTDGLFIAAASWQRPTLERSVEIKAGEIRLRWPSGCGCHLEGNPDVMDPRGWKRVEIEPALSGNRLEAIVSSAEKAQFFRLNCPD